MSEPRVAVFFYGSYMNRAVLAEVDLAPEVWEPALLPGFDIRIAPRANLVRSAQDVVYGVLASATHRELARLYAHAQDVLGESYLPEAVLVQTAGGLSRPALCYIAPEMSVREADPAYVERILAAARDLAFPEWYLAKLRSCGR
jgi:Gamma-glutamyl cyclotransferase, AIG2-like